MKKIRRLLRLIGVGGDLESLLQGFKLQLSQLDDLIADHADRHTANKDKIVALTRQNEELGVEVLKATKVRQNIAQLIEDY